VQFLDVDDGGKGLIGAILLFDSELSIMFWVEMKEEIENLVEKRAD
jgi:hypothetical protein